MANLRIYSLENQDWFKSHYLEDTHSEYQGKFLKCKNCQCSIKIIGTWKVEGKGWLYFINASHGELSCAQVIEKKNDVSEAPVEVKVEQKSAKLIEAFEDAREDVSEHDPQEENYFTNYGMSTHVLTKENLAALQQGKIISIDDGEYVHYLKLK